MDILDGAQGQDTFVFTSVTDSPNLKSIDQIKNFELGDHIDLSGIDANTSQSGDQIFNFGGSSSNKQALPNSVNWYVNGSNTYVQADVDGNTTADFFIQLIGKYNLTTSDFIL